LATYAHWYPTDTDMDWPTSVLTCQRSNVVWARRQHTAYGWILVGVAIAWTATGIGVALAHEATLATYLVAIALPSLPALLDASESARSHFAAAEARMHLEEVIDTQLDEPDGVDRAQLRETQDQLFVLRRDAPLVPDWFYKRVAGGFEDDMRYAAAQRPSNEA
ncbi:MAG: S-4TM family putative pore-forming effector, partial [Nitrososphaerales archaeon]